MSKNLVLFHHPCTDGMGGKYAAWKKFGDNAEYIGVNYGEALPERLGTITKEDSIYIIDFSFSKEVLRNLHERAGFLVVLDHHKSAQENLRGEPYAIFDMNKSGAMLAWDYFFPGTTPPTLLAMIQDRDLWQWKIPGTRNVLNYLELSKDNFSTWDAEFVPLRRHVFDRGSYISAYQDAMIEKGLDRKKLKFVKLDNHIVGITNNNYYPSEVGNFLCSRYGLDYSIVYSVTPDGTVLLSFRSDANGKNVDVSQVAKKYGGGGHRNSSGGRTDLITLSGWLNLVEEEIS